MQTFLPFSDFKKSFKVLDYKRLGKQRVEAMQIIRILEGKSSGWSTHPVIEMWKDYPISLIKYHNLCIDEWVSRGYKNNMSYIDCVENDVILPWWLGDGDFHRAMRSRLIEKDRNFYLPKFPLDEGFNDGMYFWPDNRTKTFKIINNEKLGRKS